MPEQRSHSFPLYINRILPAWGTPVYLNAAVWRSVLYNQPLMQICLRALIADCIASEWQIMARDSNEKEALKKDISHYTNIVKVNMGYGLRGFDQWVSRGLTDLYTIPAGWNNELVRYEPGNSPLSRPWSETRPELGHIAEIVYVDGGTVEIWPDPELPFIQKVPGYQPVFFNEDHWARTVFAPRVEIDRGGLGMPPPELVYLVIVILNAGDKYFWRLLGDNPPAGILNLKTMTKDKAVEHMIGIRSLFEGTEPLKVPVIYETVDELQWIPFGRPPTEISYRETTTHYGELCAAAYGLTLTDLGIGDQGRTLAGAIRAERRAQRNGFAVARESIAKLIDENILPDYLKFGWITEDEEAKVQRGRAFLVMAQALKAAKDAGLITSTEGQAQLKEDGYLTIEVEPPEELPPGPKQNQLPNGNEAAQEIADKVPAEEGGRGDITGKSVSQVVELSGSQLVARHNVPGHEQHTHSLYTSSPTRLAKLRKKVAAVQHKLEDVVNGKLNVGVGGADDLKQAKGKGLWTTRLNGVGIYARSEADAYPVIKYLQGGGRYGTPTFSRLLGYSEREIQEYQEYLGELARSDLVGKADIERALEMGEGVPDADYDLMEQLADVLKPRLRTIARKATGQNLTPLIRTAARKLFPTTGAVVKSQVGIEAEWLRERLAQHAGQPSRLDAIPDILRMDEELEGDLNEELERDRFWELALETALLTALTGIFTLAYSAGARRAAEVAGRALGRNDWIRLSFDLKNPETLRQIEESAAQLVRRVNEGTKFYLRRSIAAGVDEGLASPTIAKMIREGANLEAILSSGEFMEGVLGKVRADLDTLTDYRANSIVNTEVNRAESMGRLGQWQKMGLTRKRWVHRGKVGATHPCAVCQANQALGFVPMDYLYPTAFGDEALTPPAHAAVDHCGIEFDEDELIGRASELNVWAGE